MIHSTGDAIHPFQVDLEDTSHRPWPLPAGRWIMAQSWHDLLFAHWPLPASALRPLIPSAFEIDTFAGEAWLGIVPFRMTGVRPRWTPTLPWLSAFPELNVRTYVRSEDKPGVYFFSLDAGNLLAVLAARRWFHLPYFHARMALAERNGIIRYTSTRIHRGAPPAVFQGEYTTTGPSATTENGSLERWLTERYCLYTVDGQGQPYRGEIHHAPWSLRSAEAELARNTMAQPCGIRLPHTPPLLHFARRMDVIVWPLRRISSAGGYNHAP